MSYQITLDESTMLVQVIYAGPASLTKRMRAVSDVCTQYAHLAPLNILVDVRRLNMELSLDEQKYFGEYLATHPVLANAKVAVLHPPGHNPNLIIDATAFANGYRLAQFNLQRDAASWLLQP
ncbi:MAG TPA: hypothetical protein VIM96_08590 [Pseudomonadales bacterium]